MIHVTDADRYSYPCAIERRGCDARKENAVAN